MRTTTFIIVILASCMTAIFIKKMVDDKTTYTIRIDAKGSPVMYQGNRVVHRASEDDTATLISIIAADIRLQDGD